MHYVCVQCGAPVPSLHVEYSENEFRLTRCSACSQVADKYIEYELVLVLIDVLLHRKPAFRHLMYNRYDKLVTERVARLLPLTVILMSASLKLLILQGSVYLNADFRDFTHATYVTFMEFATFALGISICLPFLQSSSSGDNKLNRLYLAVLFPESFRVIAIVLHTFDSEPNLLFLLGLLIVSIQYVSVHSLFHAMPRLIYIGFVVGIFSKIIVKMHFYTYHDMILLGAFS